METEPLTERFGIEWAFGHLGEHAKACRAE
jgi:hypothetical protein